MNGISIVIPNWNGARTLPFVLKRVYEVMNAQQCPFEVIVIDDASTDESLETLKDFPQVRLGISQRNQGFSKTANRCVASARYELVFLISNDILLTGSINPMIEHFDDPKVFAVSPQVRWRNNGVFAYGKRTVQWDNGYFKVKEHPFIATPVYTLFACGGSAIFRKSLFMELGGFDDLYKPFYWEEIDLSYRAWKRGYTVIHEPRSTVYNTDRGVIKTNFKRWYIKLISGRNSYLFLWKNINSAKYMRRHLSILLPSLIADVLHNQWRFPLCVLMALLRLPAVLRRRSVEKQHVVVDDESVFELVASNEYYTATSVDHNMENKQETGTQEVFSHESRGNHPSAYGLTAFSG